jgi:hypothetical protein
MASFSFFRSVVIRARWHAAKGLEAHVCVDQLRFRHTMIAIRSVGQVYSILSIGT